MLRFNPTLKQMFTEAVGQAFTNFSKTNDEKQFEVDIEEIRLKFGQSVYLKKEFFNIFK